jgi:acetolactate synthase I/II/III large subunit
MNRRAQTCVDREAVQALPLRSWPLCIHLALHSVAKGQTVSASRFNTPTRINVYDAIAQVLVDDGVECVFGLLGDDTAPIVVGSVERGISYYAARHENQAVAMADGYSRATGRTGIATVTGGPGFTNALTAINSAHRAHSRVVVLVGAGRPEEDDLDAGIIRHATEASWLKHFPQASVCGILGISVVKPNSARAAPEAVQMALARAHEGETIVIILARDLVLDQIDVVGPAPSAAIELSAVATPDPAAITTLADLLEETWAIRRPVVLAGRGAVASNARQALIRLAELTGALLATTLPARGLFDGEPFDVGICGTYSTPVASGLITQADCVLAFGATLNMLTTYKNTLFPKAFVAQIDVNNMAFGRFIDVQLSLQGDALLVAEALVNELERRGHSATGFRTPETQAAIAAFNPSDGIIDQSTIDLIDPRSLMLALNKIIPPDRIFAADAGRQTHLAVQYLHVQQPRNFVQAVEFGSIGLGLGTGIGAAVGRPGTTVVVAAGDAGTMMSLGDLETAIRYRIPLVLVIANDEALGGEVNILSQLGIASDVAKIPSPSFAAIATAMGAEGATVRSTSDLAVLEDWIRRRPDVPLVLDCRVNPAAPH